MLTRAAVMAMKEDDLIPEVLIPFFERKGFHGVRLYHGGPLELGKDIVMWRPGPFSHREDFAVVVKAKPITGTLAVANEVAGQVRQAFNRRYDDREGGEKCQARFVLVVTPHTVSKEGTTAVRAIIGTEDSLENRATDFLCDGELWDQIAAVLPERFALETIANAGRVIQGAMPDVDVTTTVKAGNTELAIRQKPGAPPSMGFKISLPAGSDAAKAWEEHLATGSPGSIPGEFVTALQLPDGFNEVLGNLSVTTLQLPARAAPVGFLFQLRIVDSTGQSTALPLLPFHCPAFGTGGFRLEADPKYSPWEVIIPHGAHAATTPFKLRRTPLRSTASDDLTFFRFAQAYERGGTLEVLLPSGLLFAAAPIPAQVADAKGWDFSLWVAERAAAIESAFGVPILLSEDRQVTEEDFAALERLRAIVTTGVESVTLNHKILLERDFVKDVADGGQMVFMLRGDGSLITLFGREFDPGPVEVQFPATRVRQQFADALEGSRPEDEEILVEWRDVVAQARYNRWPVTNRVQPAAS